MRFDPSSHIPTSNMSAYISSTPKAPLDLGTAAFVTPPPAIVQQAKDLRYYRERIAQLAKAVEHDALEYRKMVAELKASGVWKSEYKSWSQACRKELGISPRRANQLVAELTELYEEKQEAPLPENADTAKSHESEMRMSLPDPTDPMADLNPPEPTKAKGNGHMTGKAVKDTLLENGESAEDYKRHHKAPTHSGKPIYAMPAWKELEEHIGKAINRTDAVNHLLPNPKAHRGLLASLKDAFTRAQSWHEEAKHA